MPQALVFGPLLGHVRADDQLRRAIQPLGWRDHQVQDATAQDVVPKPIGEVALDLQVLEELPSALVQEDDPAGLNHHHPVRAALDDGAEAALDLFQSSAQPPTLDRVGQHTVQHLRADAALLQVFDRAEADGLCPDVRILQRRQHHHGDVDVLLEPQQRLQPLAVGQAEVQQTAVERSGSLDALLQGVAVHQLRDRLGALEEVTQELGIGRVVLHQQDATLHPHRFTISRSLARRTGLVM